MPTIPKLSKTAYQKRRLQEVSEWLKGVEEDALLRGLDY